MSDEMQHVQAIDSLVANEFKVLIDGEAVAGVFSVSGLVTFRLDVKTTTAIKKLQDPFTITKMVQRDPHATFNRWIRDTFEAGGDIIRPTRTLTLQAVDDGMVTRQWTVKKAWISQVKYSDFNSSSSEMVEETVTIQYEDIEESWPLLLNDGAPGQLPASS